MNKEQFEIGEKIRVKVGAVWVKAEIESVDGEYYVCRTGDWSTHFHVSQIKKEETK